MSKYIKADALINILNAKADMAMGTLKIVFGSVAKMVELLPAADVEEVRHGEWIKLSGYSDACCSKCQRPPKILFGVAPLYCPNCGAKMDGERSKNGKGNHN